MDKQKVIWIGAAVIVLGCGWYFFSSPSTGNNGTELVATTTASTPKQTTSKSSSTQSAPRPAGGSTATKPAEPVMAAGVNTLAYLYSLKQPLVCSVTVGTTIKRTGTMYIADAKMRANFTTTSMIDDGSLLYVWTRGAAKGIQLSAVSSVSGSVIASNGGFDTANPFSFRCNSWTKDASVFTPPASVTFSSNPS